MATDDARAYHARIQKAIDDAMADWKRRTADTKRKMAEEPETNGPPPVGDLVQLCPLVYAAMASHLLEGGPEQGAAATIWFSPTGVGGVFRLRSEGLEAFFDATDVTGWWKAVERHLSDPNAKWRAAGQGRSSARPRPSGAKRKGG